MQLHLGQVGEVGRHVLPGVEDHGELGVAGGQSPVAGDQLVDDRGNTATSGRLPA
ncbi:MAG TPA: hypothetical protein VHN80_15905 [Kineosporiaceae bacterium]|nr:hypothetical protein [Kineosporiaceae bacterium]